MAEEKTNSIYEKLAKRAERKEYEKYRQFKETLAEYNKQMNDLQRDYRDAAQDAAREAYEREMENW